ncbi:MAG: YdeI/OmpD-associated family protein [Gaiellales bacterium]
MEHFEAELIAADRGGAYVEVPPEVVAGLGGKGRIPVRATFDGVEYRGSIVSMGAGRILGVLTSIRDQLGKVPGDRVAVTVEADTAERTVAVPDDLARALDAAGMRATFDALSFSHRREYVTWIEEAKGADTRARRIAGTLDLLGGEPDT